MRREWDVLDVKGGRAWTLNSVWGDTVEGLNLSLMKGILRIKNFITKQEEKTGGAGRNKLRENLFFQEGISAHGPNFINNAKI